MDSIEYSAHQYLFQGSTLETRLYITRTNNKLLFGFIRVPKPP